MTIDGQGIDAGCELKNHASPQHGWPSGPRRQTQVLVGESPRGFKSHFVHYQYHFHLNVFYNKQWNHFIYNTFNA